MEKKKEKKVKLSKKDLMAIQKQLGYHKSGVEYKTTHHGQNVYRSEIKTDWRGGVYR